MEQSQHMGGARWMFSGRAGGVGVGGQACCVHKRGMLVATLYMQLCLGCECVVCWVAHDGLQVGAGRPGAAGGVTAVGPGVRHGTHQEEPTVLENLLSFTLYPDEGDGTSHLCTTSLVPGAAVACRTSVSHTKAMAGASGTECSYVIPSTQLNCLLPQLS
jgi:hypothetical protein